MRRPPYFKRLQRRSEDRKARKKAGLTTGGPQVLWVLCGSGAWDQAKSMEPYAQLFLVLPDDTNPAALDWSMHCIDKDLTWGDEAFVNVLGAYDYERVKGLVVAMMLQGFKKVFVFLNGEQFKLVRFYREDARG